MTKDTSSCHVTKHHTCFCFPVKTFCFWILIIKKNLWHLLRIYSFLFFPVWAVFLNDFQLSDIRNTPTVLYFDFKEFLIFVFVILFSHICLFCICALVHDRDYLCLFGLLPFLPRPTGHPVEIYNEISGHNLSTWVQVCAFRIRIYCFLKY